MTKILNRIVIISFIVVLSACKKDKAAPPYIDVLSSHSLHIEVVRQQSESGVNSSRGTGAAGNKRTRINISSGDVVRMEAKDSRGKHIPECEVYVFDNYERQIYKKVGATHQLNF